MNVSLGDGEIPTGRDADVLLRNRSSESGDHRVHRAPHVTTHRGIAPRGERACGVHVRSRRRVLVIRPRARPAPDPGATRVGDAERLGRTGSSNERMPSPASCACARWMARSGRCGAHRAPRWKRSREHRWHCTGNITCSPSGACGSTSPSEAVSQAARRLLKRQPSSCSSCPCRHPCTPCTTERTSCRPRYGRRAPYRRPCTADTSRCRHPASTSSRQA